MAKIICIGSSSKDIFFPTGKGLIYDTPEDVESQRKMVFELGAKYQVARRFEALGGCAANVSVGLARLGTESACYTVVGADAIGDWIRRELEKEKVETGLVQREDSARSDLSVIIVDEPSGERIIFSDRDANDRLEIEEKKIADCQWVFVSSLNGDWRENLKRIFAIAKEKGIRIAFNPGQKNIATGAGAVAEALSQADLLFVNKDEAIEIVEKAKPEASVEELNDEKYLLEALKEAGAGIAILTDGVRGAWCRGEGEILHAEVLLEKAVDSTGAGDAFTSGFLASYVGTEDVAQALKWGIANSSNTVKSYGGQEGLLTKEGMAERIGTVKAGSI